MNVRRVALIYDDTLRPETTGTYCRRALEKLAEVVHFRPGQLSTVPKRAFDLYLNIDDGLSYRLPADLRPSALWAIDTHLDFERSRQRAPDFDFVFAAQRDGAERLRCEGIAGAVWLPLACDPEIHCPHDVLKQYDVAFVGNLVAGGRIEAVKRLQERFARMFVGNRYFQDMAETYSASRVVFNRSIRNDVNMRVFEALACGSLLVTNDLADNGQEELFRDGEHLAVYRDLEELIEKVAFYLDHEDQRERIAAAGRKEAVAKHTYRHRMETILRHVQSAVGRKAPAPAPPRPARPKDRSYYEFPRPELAALVPLAARRVLDVGCAAGRLGAALKARQEAWVCGIEMDAEAARQAKTLLDEVVLGDAEQVNPPVPEGGFDCILCGDVLEHMVDPQRFLQRARPWLAPAGHLVASVPNVRHHSVVRSLLAGEWTYEPAGLLDETHLHFFTRRDLVELFESAGYAVLKIQVVPGPGYDQWREQGRPGDLRLGSLILRGLSADEAEEFFAYQYLVSAVPAPAAAQELTTILIVTHNALDYTRQCLKSIRAHTPEPHEVVVVDNGSTDGTAEYLRGQGDVVLVADDTNRGFPAAVNQGLTRCRGSQVCLVNNDVLVTDGWLGRLLAAMSTDPRIGLVGPATNCTSGPQRVEVPYQDPAEAAQFAREWAERHRGHLAEVPVLMGFCLLVRREVFDKIGLLDERFGIGSYEDVDFCHRARQAGYRLAFAQEAFVHHSGHQTFRQNRIDADAVAAQNEVLLVEKWTEAKAPLAAPANLTQAPPGTLSILYVGDFLSPGKSEQYAAAAIRSLGHRVDVLHDADVLTPQHLLDVLRAGGYDCLLFCKGCLGARSLEERLHPTGDKILPVLRDARVPCYTWYFDRAFQYDFDPSREAWMRKVAPWCRVAFVTDAGLCRTNWAPWHVLREGVSRPTVEPVDVSEDQKNDVAFIGQVYGSRADELRPVAARYDLKMIAGVFGRALNRVIRAQKIILGPRYPSAPGYWSNRIYLVLGHGGFFLAPEVEGMREEGFLPGVHYAPLGDDPVADIRHWLDRPDERERIARAGQELVLSRFTYEHRAEEMCRVISGTLATRTSRDTEWNKTRAPAPLQAPVVDRRALTEAPSPGAS